MLIPLIVSQLVAITMPQARALALRPLMFCISLQIIHISIFTKQRLSHWDSLKKVVVLYPCGLWASPLGGPWPAAADPSSLVNHIIKTSVRLGEGTCGQKRDGLICSRLKETSKTA